MPSRYKKIYINSLSFVILLISWWAIGMSAAQKAEHNIGKVFESSILTGSYYNDWLPVIISMAWGVGWGIATVVITFKKTYSRGISFQWLFLIFIPPTLCWLLIFIARNMNSSFTDEFLEPSLMPFLSGIVFGLAFAELQNMKRGSDE
ncbi:MAG: hypothetical protein MHPDNHAH_02454 [Anaerolineales bacterium]|nr:hypothetical protein [Anaerolineales bacterium]WKZ47855.1 MAG: hypothetical protein QY306_00640 [Anaerolineales bacterium]